MKTKIFLLLNLFLVVVSCEKDEDFLKEVPKTFYTLENAFSTSTQVDGAVIACYEHVRWMYTHQDNFHVFFTLYGNGTDIRDVPLYRMPGSTFSDYTQIDPSNHRFETIFTRFYQLISKANTAIYAANLENIKWQSEEEKKYIIAQAKFFRAFAYRNLGELFGGVPIVESIVTEPKFDFERSTTIETYQFAIDDLESSLADLPETTIKAGRIVKGAAQHYLSQLYLDLGVELEEQGQSGDEMFDKAISYANQVIDGGTYALMTERFGTRKDETPSTPPFWSPGTADVYWDLFQEGNVNYQDGNMESIWAFQIDFDAWLTKDSRSALQWPRDYVGILRRVSGFDGTAEDGGGRGIGSIGPTFHVREGVWEGSVGENDIRNKENNLRRTFYYNVPNHPEYGKPIPYSVIYSTDNWRSLIWPVHMKLTTDKFTGLDQGNNYTYLFRDEYAIRLPETIFLRAEAYLRKGDLQKAADDINLIRDRAQSSYIVTAGDIDLDFILDERIRELFGEEHRWNTLLRMRGTVAVDRIRKYAFWPAHIATLTWDFNVWPIPQSIIDRNIDVKLEQNPGWKQF